MKTKPSMLFVVGVVVALLLIAGSALLLVSSKRSVHRLEQDLAMRRQELSSAYQRDPFPAAENVQRENDNAASLNTWYAKLVGQAGKEQLDLEERSPSAFLSQLGTTQRELLATANDLSRVPRDFAFGFERYFGEGSKLPSPEHVPRLTQQLVIIDSLSRLMFGQNVAKIRSIQREVFEGGVSDAARRGAKGLLENPQAGLLAADALFSKFHFILEMEARESTVLGILNELAKRDLFIVVTRVDFKKQTADVKPVEPRAAREPQSDQPAIVAKPLERAERLVCGLALETPMIVTMEVDVYRFRKAGE